MKKTERSPQQVYQDYQDRLYAEARKAQQKQRGRVIWDSSRRGTYIKAKHGTIGGD